MTIDEMCSQLSSSSVTSMSSFYTRGSSLYLVLYWYSGYTSINATVSVYVTKCQGVYLNICTYHHYCRIDYEESLFLNFMYTHTVGHHTRISFHDCYTNLFKQYFSLPAGECVVLILTDKVSPFKENMYQFLVADTCEILLASYPFKKHKFAHINGFLAKGNYLEVVQHKDCTSSKHPICGKILKARSVSQFQHVKFTNRFTQQFSNEIDCVLVKVHSEPTRNQINIKLTGGQKKETKMQYTLTAHQLGIAISNLLLSVALQQTSQGFTWLISIEKNIQLGHQFETAVCTFKIKRYFLHDMTRTIYVNIGKFMHF